MIQLVSLKDAGLVLSANSRVLIIGTIGSGKSYVTRHLAQQNEAIMVYSIDDFRRECMASSESGEAAARQKFLLACAEQDGIFEFTGAGPLHEPVMQAATKNPFDFILRVHTPTQVCMERVAFRRDWPPYPNNIMPDSDLINAISNELDRHGFDRQSSDWNGQLLLHVSGVME